VSFPVAVLGLGVHIPPRIITNEYFAQMLDTSDEWIRSRTGIGERRFVEENVCTSDIAALAARQALQRAGLEAGEIDLIIVATATPDHLFPSTACGVQDKIQANHAAAFDISAGCSGFLYALSTAVQFVANGSYQKVMVVGAETLSKFIDMEDRQTCVLLGDGAGAMIVGVDGERNDFLPFILEADGRGGQALNLPAGGSVLPASSETVQGRKHYVQMNGREVYKWAVEKITQVSRKALDQASLSLEDISFFVPHQANLRIIEGVAERLHLPPEKLLLSLPRYGNTSAASIPITLEEGLAAGRIQTGNLLLMAAFGAGFTWAAGLLRWSWSGWHGQPAQ
jgi:3-oxoacyl-[acyl-carrier-protein] synthase-3